MAEKSGSSPSNKQWISLALMISSVPHAACHSERTAQRSSLQTSLEAPADYDRNIFSRSIDTHRPIHRPAGNEPTTSVTKSRVRRASVERVVESDLYGSVHVCAGVQRPVKRRHGLVFTGAVNRPDLRAGQLEVTTVPELYKRINLICVSAIDFILSPQTFLICATRGGCANLGGRLHFSDGRFVSRSPTRSVGCRGVHQPTLPTRDASQNHIFVHICGARSGPTRSEFRRLCREWALLRLRSVLGSG